MRFSEILKDASSSSHRCVSCLAPPLRSGAKQLGPLPMFRAYVVQPEPASCLRYAPDTNLAFASSETASYGAVLGVELEQSLQRGKLHTDIATYR
jgi:hypothetical protein